MCVEALPPGVSASAIPYSEAYNAHRGSSFVPEKRAKARQDEYLNLMKSDYEQLSKMARNDEEKAMLDGEFERYASGYASYYRKGLLADSRTMSSMITGPSNFPTERNRKRLDIARRRWDELGQYRERAHAAIRKAVRPDLSPVMAGQANAVELLQQQLAKLKDDQQRMKEANALVRKCVTYDKANKVVVLKKGKTEAEYIAAAAKINMSEEMAKKLLQPDFCGRIGFAGYQLTNNNANIKRIEERIKSISSMKAMPETEVKYEGGVTVLECPQDARIRITFPGKPSRDKIDALKARGFKWSPTNMAWQRNLNSGGQWAAAEIVKLFGLVKDEK